MGIARLRDVPWSAPSMLNIDHLRKQAKLYLRWHREQYYPVAARIRAVLPRYSRLTDREILASPSGCRTLRSSLRGRLDSMAGKRSVGEVTS